MNIIVYGGGFLGKDIADYLGATLDTRHMTSPSQLEEGGTAPDVIINAAGKTGRPNVDWCEDHKDETYFANVTLAKMFADHARRHNIRLVHLSSGCIYEGENGGHGFTEDDAPNFEGSFYSHTKAEAERQLAEYDNVLTIRPRMPISAVPSPRNLLHKLLGYEKIINVKNSVTITPDLLRSLGVLVASGCTGTFNMVNPDPVTHKDILELYEKHSGRTLHKEYITMGELVVKAPRSNTILSAEKLARAGAPMPSTKESLEKIIEEYVQQEALPQNI